MLKEQKEEQPSQSKGADQGLLAGYHGGQEMLTISDFLQHTYNAVKEKK